MWQAGNLGNFAGRGTETKEQMARCDKDGSLHCWHQSDFKLVSQCIGAGLS